MGLYLKLFDTHSQYENYTADTSNFILPNVSVCKDVPNVVHYNPIVPYSKNIITYEANAKLTETTSAYSSGLHTYAFKGVSNKQLTMISHSFENGVGTITFDDDIVKFDAFAFYGCSAFTSIDIPDSITSIGSQAFRYCSGLTSINIPSGVTSIGSQAFENCSALTSIDIPSGVTAINSQVFNMCTSLTSIDIPSGVTSIGNSAFNNCSSLISINIPSGVTSIGENAFLNCSGLTSIDIPSGVTSIGSDAFYDCTNVSDVYCYPNPANLTWDEYGKDDFKSDGSTICHIYSQYLSEYEANFGNDVNVTFVGDLT